MLIRVFLFLVLSIVTQLSANADISSYFSMKATIKLSDGSVKKGYFSLKTYDLSIRKERDGYVYSIAGNSMRLGSSVGSSDYAVDIAETDYHFSNAVRI